MNQPIMGNYNLYMEHYYQKLDELQLSISIVYVLKGLSCIHCKSVNPYLDL
jgi:hypothetical protein